MLTIAMESYTMLVINIAIVFAINANKACNSANIGKAIRPPIVTYGCKIADF